MKSKRIGLALVVIVAALALWIPQSQAGFIVNIQPILLCEDDGTGCAGVGPAGNEYYEAETDKIWAQADIDINFLALQQWNNSTFTVTDSNGQTADTADDDDALRAAGKTQFGSIADTMAINMYFVTDFLTTPGFTLFGSGCGHPTFAAACNNEEGIIINDVIFSLGRIDTIAHEIGHVLGLTHSDFGASDANPENFMPRGAARTPAGTIGDIAPDGANLDQMTQDQIDVVFQDQLNVIKTPEPTSIAGFGTGVLAIIGLGALRRRRTHA
jgi:hypothetical protein